MPELDPLMPEEEPVEDALWVTSMRVAAALLLDPGVIFAVWPDFRSVILTVLPSTITTVFGSTVICVSFWSAEARMVMCLPDRSTLTMVPLTS